MKSISIPPLPTETPMRKRIHDRLNLRASLIQVPTPPTSTPTVIHPEIHSKDVCHFSTSDYSTSSLDSGANDESLILQEISLLASARKSQFQTQTTLSETSRLNSRLELTDKIKMIFEEEKTILRSIDTASKEQALSRMKIAALQGFAQVMESVTRNELNSLRGPYKHLSLTWITLARFEACHGHLTEALNLLKEGLEEVKRNEGYDSKEVDELMEATRQIQNNYGDNKCSYQNESIGENCTPKKRQRLTKNQSESLAVMTPPRRSPRFVKSSK